MGRHENPIAQLDMIATLQSLVKSAIADNQLFLAYLIGMALTEAKERQVADNT